MSTGVKAHVAGSCGCKAGWFERWLSRPLIGLFPSIIYLCIGLRCRFCEVHRRHLMHGGTQTIRFWGLQHVHWCEGSCCWFLRLQSRLVWEVAIQAVDWFVPEHHLCIGLRCRFCEVHRRHLMHGGTQTIRFWGLQHVHWCPEGIMMLVLCGCKAGWFEGGIQAVFARFTVGIWCMVARKQCRTGVKAHVAGSCGYNRGGHPGRVGLFPSIIYLCIGLRCRFCEVHRRHLMHGGTQTIPLLGATTCPLVWRLMLLVLAAAKQVGLRGGYPGRWLVCSRASSIYVLV